MFFEYAISILVASLVGGLIGFEREYRDKSAGFRTMILIAVGSCLFTIFSDIMGDPDNESTRIAAAIVTGVGFLGAGVIIKDGTAIRGLTTAAAIWLVASLGMGAGLGLYQLVSTVAVFVFLVLFFLPPFERWIDSLHDFVEVHITIKNTQKAENKIIDLITDAGVRVREVRRTRANKGERTLHIMIKANQAKHDALSELLVSERSVIAFDE